MEIEFETYKIKILVGDITTMATDAIVNAANNSLLGGGGVDGAIHRAAGPGLLRECRTLNGCRTGEAKTTNAYKLPCRFVIHTVGPVYQAGNAVEQELLKSAYQSSLNEASERGLETIAFPSISTGVYGYPMDKAAKDALESIVDFMKRDCSIKIITIVLFSESYYPIWKKAARELSRFD